jgi:glutamine cyclotransferase
MTVLGGKIYQLTWKNQKGFVYDLATFTLEKEFAYTGEGWGLTTDGQSLILSDGTHQLRFLDPVTFKVTRTVNVLRDGQPLRLLNELEFIRGEIYANIWQSHTVARIAPATGHVIGLIDFFGLLPDADRTADTDVLNGLAYDAATDRLFVTGKHWPKLFEVRLKPARP